MYFHALKAFENLLTNASLSKNRLDHARDDRALDSTPTRSPDATDFLLAGVLTRHGTGHVHILSVRDTRLR